MILCGYLTTVDIDVADRTTEQKKTSTDDDQM
jgi:hypothetical protein